jgi:hypothetical protein
VAQDKNIISGRVLNAETESVVPNASVFITNTSKGTITASDGRFELKSIPAGKYDLIISSVGYTTQVYSFTTDKLPLQLRVYLQPKVTELDAVVVEPYEKDGWQKWGTFFIENFIGTTDAAKLCKIRNYKTLRFRHSKKKNTLTAVADEPLLIENRELGYKIHYQLEEFSYDFKNQTLFYLGYTLFEDMAKNPAKTPKRYLRERQKAYNGSIVHFLRSLYNKNLVENGFEVRRMIRIPNKEKERVRDIIHGRAGKAADKNGNLSELTEKNNARATGHVRNNPDSTAYYDRILQQKDYEEVVSKHILSADSLVSVTAGGQILFFENYIHIMYRKGLEEPGYLIYSRENRKPYHPRSVASLLNGNPVAIEKNGSCYPPTEFFSSGYWAWNEKISHLLPTDYDETTSR